MAVTARQWFGARPFRRNEGPPERARRGDTVSSPSRSRFGTGDGNLTRFGCPSLKTKTLDCTRRPEHAALHRCTASESSGGGAKCGMSHRIRQKRIPIRALGEPKTKGSGTSRVVAESNHGGLLNPNRCWDSVRRKCVGQPTGTFGISRHSCREVRRQRTGRVGQSSSSEFKSSRGGLAGFPTGNASRRNVSRKAGEAE
jgi:hypothetical protein